MKEYEAVGMQEMLDAVRSTGAKNVVIAGGLAFAYDFDGILEGRQLKDPTGNGVIYANHAYDYFGESIFTWIASMKEAQRQISRYRFRIWLVGRPQSAQGVVGEQSVSRAERRLAAAPAPGNL